MKLLTLAHRGEAQTFFKELHLSPVKDYEGLYCHENFYLLITGEGKEEALALVSYTLGRLHDKVSEVINIGLCGALRSNLKLETIHFIRTIYSENDGDITFKSFSTQDNGLDIVTSNRRVLDSQYASYLDNFAPLVDRELWAIAHACKIFHKPLRALKLISDYANGKEICKIVKEKQEEYADQLYRATQPILFQKKEQSQSNISPEGIYLSISMQRRYQSLLHSLLIKYACTENDIFEKLKLKELQQKDILPKKKGHILLDQMSALLSPYRAKLESKIQDYFQPLSKLDIQAKPDKDLDNSKVQFSFSAESKEELDLKIYSIKNMDFSEYKKIIFGDNDVF